MGALRPRCFPFSIDPFSRKRILKPAISPPTPRQDLLPPPDPNFATPYSSPPFRYQDGEDPAFFFFSCFDWFLTRRVPLGRVVTKTCSSFPSLGMSPYHVSIFSEYFGTPRLAPGNRRNVADGAGLDFVPLSLS